MDEENFDPLPSQDKVTRTWSSKDEGTDYQQNRQG